MGSYDPSFYHRDALSKLVDPTLFINDAFINGEWVQSDDMFDVIEPSTEAVLGKVASCDAHHFQTAIASAHEAQSKYFVSTTALERGILLNKWAELILQHKTDGKLCPGQLRGGLTNFS